MRYRLHITKPLAVNGASWVWVERQRTSLLRHWRRWQRVTPKARIKLRQPMPNGALWDLGEHATEPKQVATIRKMAEQSL